jgi:hypothetical protein
MNDLDCQMLANLGKLNHAMGLATRDLLHNIRADGRLPADALRDLARICDDMAALLDNAADAIEPPHGAVPVVIEGSERPQIHADIARLRDSAHRCVEQGLVEAAENFSIAAAALADRCGCGGCPQVPHASGAGLTEGETA